MDVDVSLLPFIYATHRDTDRPLSLLFLCTATLPVHVLHQNDNEGNDQSEHENVGTDGEEDANTSVEFTGTSDMALKDVSMRT